jgi:hypothetical protein
MYRINCRTAFFQVRSRVISKRAFRLQRGEENDEMEEEGVY